MLLNLTVYQTVYRQIIYEQSNFELLFGISGGRIAIMNSEQMER